MKNETAMRCWAAAGLLASTACLAQAAGKAHEHGVVRLDIAVDGRTLSIALESPLDSLVGFEHAPRTPAERRRADQAIAALRAADTLFKIDPAAGCRLAGVELAAPVLGLGTPAKAEDDGHGDLDADLRFECRDAGKARRVELALFESFPGMQRIDVQVAAPAGQFKQTLKRGEGAAAVKLAR